MKKTALILAALVTMGMGIASASTGFGYGTIIKVDMEGRKGPTLTCRLEYYNYKSPALWMEGTYAMKGSQTYYFLDGKMSTAEEAVKVGRAVVMMDDIGFLVSSKPGPHVLGATGTATDGLCRITLANALQVEGATVKNGKSGPAGAIKQPVELMLELTPETVRGWAVVGAFGDVLCNLPLDCSGLKRDGDTISGKVSMAQTLDRKHAPIVLSEGDRIEWELTLNATMGADGAVGGSYEGTCNGAAVSGELDGETVARSAMPAHPRAWIELNGLEHLSKGQNYIVVTFKDGQAEPGGRIVWRKGNRVGEVSDQDLTWSGNTLKGTVTCKEKARTYPVTIDAQVYGNRFVVGTYAADGGQPLMFRGGITEADTGELAEPTPEQKKQIFAVWGKGKK